MAKRDFYDILGVSRTASADEIKRAYRDLARKMHPDVSKDPNAQAKFTEVQDAYDVLSDPDKRAIYDRGGRAAPGGSWQGGQPGQEYDLDDLGSIFDTFFGGQGADPFARKQAGPGARPRRQPLRHEITISFMTAARGGSHRVQLTADGRAKSIDVQIPRGVVDGAKLRVRAGGGASDLDRDVLLTVRVGAHPVFRRLAGASGGLDLEFDLPITIVEATLGTRVWAPTLAGAVELSVPAGTASGRKLRLKGRGMSSDAGDSGDLLAVIKIVPPHPDALSDEERRMLSELGRTLPTPRQGEHWQEGWSA